VQTPVVSGEGVIDMLSQCRYCPDPGGGGIAPGIEPEAAFVDTLVVTTFALEAEIDCRSCVEFGECEIQTRECVCLDGTVELEGLDIGALLSGHQISDVARGHEYCLSVATVLAEGAPGEACNCTPTEWGLPRRAAVSCTYTRRAKSPGDDQLVLNQTICQNSLDEFFTIDGDIGPPPPLDGGGPDGGEVGPPPTFPSECDDVERLEEALNKCAGLPPT